MRTRVVSWWVLLWCAFWMGGCRTEPSVGAIRIEGHLSQALEAGAVARVSVTLTAADVDARTVELVEAGGTWSGSMEAIPAGEGRTFRATAFDTAGTPRYAGQVSGVTVLAGRTALVALTLQPLAEPPPFTNAAPRIDAVVASARTVAPGGEVSLQATAHDPNPEDTLAYAWSAPAGTFSAASSAATTWSAPSAPGAVPLTLTVTDSRGASASLTLTLTVHAGTGGADLDVTLNTWPRVAHLTATPSTVAPGQSTTVAVSASDADGDALAYQWSAVGCTGSWSGETAATAHFTPSAVPPGGACDCHLGVTVSDGRGGQGRGTLSVCVGPPPGATFPPEIVAASRSSDTAAPGASVTLRVEAVDPQGSALGFTWAASLGTLSTPVTGASASELTWTAPACTSAGPASLTATVRNALGLSTAYTFTFGGLPACFPPHDSWTSIGGLWRDVGQPSATVLPSGQVLVAGGAMGSTKGSSNWAQLYDVATGLGMESPGMLAFRVLHTATLLPSGQVLLAGGVGWNSASQAHVELYEPATGAWSLTGALTTERAEHTATPLPSGHVLVVGGRGWNPESLLRSAEVYTPATGTWSAAAVPAVAHRAHTATVLASGRVLVAGGHTAVAELYEPATGTWSPTGSLGVSRREHAAVRLASGRVLVLGGRGGTGGALRTAELYDPATGTWSPTGSLGADHAPASAVLLASGKVLVAGGGSAAAELYDPATGTWTATASLSTSRLNNVLVPLPSGKVLAVGGTPGRTAVEVFDPALGQWSSPGVPGPNWSDLALTLLPSGQALASGGTTFSWEDGNRIVSQASLFEPTTRTWSFTGSLLTPRRRHTQTVLPSGKVLVVGGRSTGESVLNTAEVYEPTTGTWSPTGAMQWVRAFHTATLLPSGKVLVTGGGGDVSVPEVYDPATGTWSLTGGAFTSDFGILHTATLLPSGKVLVVGGWSNRDPAFNQALLYDAATNTWSATGSMTGSRYDHTATLLPSGKVLVTGGGAWLEEAELYDPATGTWSLTARLHGQRYASSETLLSSGKVLVVGGRTVHGTDGSPDEHRADVYDPATETWSAVKAMGSRRAGHRTVLLPSGQVLLVGATGLDDSPSQLYTP